MYFDAYGNPHESFPGELAGRGTARQQNPQPQQTQQSETFPRMTFDIIFVPSRDDIDRIKVNSGCKQVFAGQDNSFFAVKEAVGNSYTVDFFPLEKPAPAPAQVDPSMIVTRDQIQPLVSAAMLEFFRQQKEGGQNGTV